MTVLTEKEAAQYIRMSMSFLRNARIYGAKPGSARAPNFIKIGRKVRYLKTDLDKYLNKFRKFQHVPEIYRVKKRKGSQPL